MDVYRICLAKYAKELFASGMRGRWNLKGDFVIYTAGSRALACLENVVHRSGEGLSDNFKTVVIEIPDDLTIESISAEALPTNWQEVKSYPVSQSLGHAWYQQRTSAVMRSVLHYTRSAQLHPQHAPPILFKNLDQSHRGFFL